MLTGGALRFASTTRPLFVLVTIGWALHATGFWRVGLPVDRLLSAESVSDMFQLTARNFHENWLIGGSRLGWIMLGVVLVVTIAVETILSRRKARLGQADIGGPGEGAATQNETREDREYA